MDPLLINADQQPVKRPKSNGSRDALNHWGETIVYAPWRTPDRRWISGSILATVMVIAGVWAFMTLRPMPKPDAANDGMDRIFGYALLRKEFNDLPIEERLELVGQIVQRVKSMDQSDSLMLASFAAGIQGAARDQLLENTSKLMMDTADMMATDYTQVAHEDREEFLDDAFIRLTEIAAALGGEEIDEPREERLEEARSQAKRDQEQMEGRPMSMRQAGRAFKFMDGDMGQHSSPQQRGRITVFMRDMVRNLRDQDVATGRPKGGG